MRSAEADDRGGDARHGADQPFDLGGVPRDTAAQRLVDLDATVLGEERPPGLDLAWTVMADPEGTEFRLGG